MKAMCNRSVSLFITPTSDTSSLAPNKKGRKRDEQKEQIDILGMGFEI